MKNKRGLLTKLLSGDQKQVREAKESLLSMQPTVIGFAENGLIRQVPGNKTLSIEEWESKSINRILITERE